MYLCAFLAMDSRSVCAFVCVFFKRLYLRVCVVVVTICVFFIVIVTCVCVCVLVRCVQSRVYIYSNRHVYVLFVGVCQVCTFLETCTVICVHFGGIVSHVCNYLDCWYSHVCTFFFFFFFFFFFLMNTVTCM